MDVNLYYEILKWREEDPYKTDATIDSPQQIGVSIFHKDVLLDKALWTNRRRIDFKYWLQSYHPLIGVMFAPKCHPYSKQYRLANISLLLFIGSFWSIFSCFYTRLYLSMGAIPNAHLYPTLLLSSFINAWFLYFIEWLLVKSLCFKSCFKLLVSIPGCVLITIAIIAILGSMVIAVELDYVSRFLFIFSMEFIVLWTLQISVLFLLFLRQWNFDHRLLSPDNEYHTGNGGSSSNNHPDKISMVSVSAKNPYYVTFMDYQEFVAQRGVDSMDISISNDEHSNNLVLGYTPPDSL